MIKRLRFLLIKSNESDTEARSRCTEFVSDVMYEGRSINKLQNDVILLFSKFKNSEIYVLGDLILSTSCEFYYHDITVTSFILIRYGSVAAESIP